MIHCPVTVHWWAEGLTVRCIRKLQHGGFHTDGLWWWDDNGIKQPSAEQVESRAPGARAHAGRLARSIPVPPSPEPSKS